MEKKKLKNEQSILKKKNTKVKREEVLGQTKEQESAVSTELVALWKQEIENIKSEKFQSIEEAASRVACLVVQKLGLPEVKRKETEEFVSTLLVTDPDAAETLRALL